MWFIPVLLMTLSITATFLGMYYDSKVTLQQQKIDRIIELYNKNYIAQQRLNAVMKQLDAEDELHEWLKEYIV